jgi:hypothetical protein
MTAVFVPLGEAQPKKEHLGLFNFTISGDVLAALAANHRLFSVMRERCWLTLTLGNMRANGARSLAVTCLLCHHQAMLAADEWPDHVPVPSFGPRMVCTGCGIIGADARPNWSERPNRPSLTGRQWH